MNRAASLLLYSFLLMPGAVTSRTGTTAIGIHLTKLNSSLELGHLLLANHTASGVQSPVLLSTATRRDKER